MRPYSCSIFQPDIGAFWANCGISETAKRNVRPGSPGKLSFWRTRVPFEVDLT